MVERCADNADVASPILASPTRYGGYSIKVMCLAVNQVKSEHYRLATPDEIGSLSEVVERSGLQHHWRIARESSNLSGTSKQLLEAWSNGISRDC